MSKTGRGKYALIKLRDPDAVVFADCTHGIVKRSAVDFGDKPETEFFVIRLKDKYASSALAAYAMAAYVDDPEYGLAVLNLAKRAAEHPLKVRPH